MPPDNSVDAARGVPPCHPRSKHYLLVGVIIVTLLFNLTSDLIQPSLILVLIAVTKGTAGGEREGEREGESERERERERQRERVCERVRDVVWGGRWVCGWEGVEEGNDLLTTSEYLTPLSKQAYLTH